jgi:hypothetical protein
MDSQQVRDVFLEAFAETSVTDDGGLFAHVVYQLTGAIDISEVVEGEVRIDATALVEGALEAVALLGGAWAADHGVTLQVASRGLPGPPSHRVGVSPARRPADGIPSPRRATGYRGRCFAVPT